MAERGWPVKPKLAPFAQSPFPFCDRRFTSGFEAERTPPESLTRGFSCFVLWRWWCLPYWRAPEFIQIRAFALRIDGEALTPLEDAPLPLAMAVKVRCRALNKGCPNHGTPAIHALSGRRNTIPCGNGKGGHKAVPPAPSRSGERPHAAFICLCQNATGGRKTRYA